MEHAFMVVAIIISVLLIVPILLQVKGSGLGDLLGGSNTGGSPAPGAGWKRRCFRSPSVSASHFWRLPSSPPMPAKPRLKIARKWALTSPERPALSQTR
ncbi:MAG: hypothetical protein U0521_09970 [Anaerolineae bacterium]